MSSNPDRVSVFQVISGGYLVGQADSFKPWLHKNATFAFYGLTALVCLSIIINSPATFVIALPYLWAVVQVTTGKFKWALLLAPMWLLIILACLLSQYARGGMGMLGLFWLGLIAPIMAIVKGVMEINAMARGIAAGKTDEFRRQQAARSAREQQARQAPQAPTTFAEPQFYGGGQDAAPVQQRARQQSWQPQSAQEYLDDPNFVNDPSVQGADLDHDDKPISAESVRAIEAELNQARVGNAIVNRFADGPQGRFANTNERLAGEALKSAKEMAGNRPNGYTVVGHGLDESGTDGWAYTLVGRHLFVTYLAPKKSFLDRKYRNIKTVFEDGTDNVTNGVGLPVMTGEVLHHQKAKMERAFPDYTAHMNVLAESVDKHLGILRSRSGFGLGVSKYSFAFFEDTRKKDETLSTSFYEMVARLDDMRLLG